MHRLFLASAGVTSFAGALGLTARYADIGHGWSVFGGVLAIFAWCAFERRSRRIAYAPASGRTNML